MQLCICWRSLYMERSEIWLLPGWYKTLRFIPSRTISSMSASESLFLVAAVAVDTLVGEVPPNQMGEARISGKVVMTAAKTKTTARVAATDQVAVAGVEDADDALRMGAGR